MYTNENDLFEANSNTALTNSTTTNAPPTITTNNDDETNSNVGIKNPRELFPGRPTGQAGNNNDGSQGKFFFKCDGLFQQSIFLSNSS